MMKAGGPVSHSQYNQGTPAPSPPLPRTPATRCLSATSRHSMPEQPSSPLTGSSATQWVALAAAQPLNSWRARLEGCRPSRHGATVGPPRPGPTARTSSVRARSESQGHNLGVDSSSLRGWRHVASEKRHLTAREPRPVPLPQLSTSGANPRRRSAWSRIEFGV